MTLLEFLLWLAVGGGSAVALSFVTERAAWFQTWTKEAKSYFHLGGSVILSLGAWAILTYAPPEVLEYLQTPFQIVAGVFSAWLLNQLGHKADPAA